MSLASERVEARAKPTVNRFLAVLVLCFCGFRAEPLRAQALEEVAGTRKICESDPNIRVARAERLAGAAYAAAADVLPNPSLVVAHQRALSGGTEHETIIGVSVPLRIGGRRSLLQDAAVARSEQASAAADSTLFESAVAFRRAYARAVIDQARVAVLEQQQERLTALSATILGLAKGGEAAEYDSLRQRVQAREHQRELESAKAQARASLALLQAWLGSNVTLPSVKLLDLAGGELGDRHPVDGSSAQHPELRRLDAQARASELEARAADRLWVPELELFAGYRTTTVTTDTGHGIALSLRVPLTFFDHGQGEAAHAHAEQQRALANAFSLQRQYGARLQSLDAYVQVLAASAVQLDSAIADASALQDKARLLYAAGEASITELLEAFRAAEQARLGSIDLAEEVAQARLERMHAAGTLLDATLDQACNATHRRTP